MKVYTIDCGFFKLDGGAMFGVVPKSLWQKANPADENNLCTWALRCLLIETDDHIVLIDNGMGNKQSEKFFRHYHPHGNTDIDKALNAKGFQSDDITDVILTHLHFDHCGGSVRWNKNKTAYETTFKNATYWTEEKHWNWALHPNSREKASFLKENLLPIQEAGQLQFVRHQDQNSIDILPGISIRFANGHTENMMIPVIHHPATTLVYMADLIPSTAHIPLPWLMSYDLRPLLTLKEKEDFLQVALNEHQILFFEHDPVYESCSLIMTEKGIRQGKAGNLNELLKSRE